MLTCDDARDEIAVDPATSDLAVQDHIRSCPACATYARRHANLEGVIRAELRRSVPADLSARLLTMALTPGTPMLVRARPKRWHVALAYLATLMSIILSLVIGWQVFELINAQIDLQAQVAMLVALPGQALAYLTQQLPESRYAVDLFLRIRDQLVWLLLVAVVWAMLDKWNPNFSFRRQQRV